MFIVADLVSLKTDLKSFCKAPIFANKVKYLLTLEALMYMDYSKVHRPVLPE